jgi:hypothetical protein
LSIPNTQLQTWLKIYSLDILEQTLLQEYCASHALEWRKSTVLSTYFADNAYSPSLAKHLGLFSIDSLSELESCLELMIPAEDRKLNGAFFTPTYIIDAIVNRLSPRPEETVFDPSCGSGAFLLGVTRYMMKQYQMPIRQLIRENIFGADILPYNIRRAKILLALFALQQGEILDETDFRLTCIDSLQADWNDIFSHSKFDVVLGNPPYVKFQDLSDVQRENLAKNWSSVDSGTFNTNLS